MFANTFTLAPLFSFCCNMVEISTKQIRMCSYSRKGKCQGASGIGAWLPVMETIAIICIPVNTGIIYFTGDTTLFKEGSSSYVKFMIGLDSEKWTTTNIILLIVLVEHVLLLLKVVIANLIDDIPTKVIAAEQKRVFILSKAQEFMRKQKEDSNVQSLQAINQGFKDKDKAETQ